MSLFEVVEMPVREVAIGSQHLYDHQQWLSLLALRTIGGHDIPWGNGVDFADAHSKRALAVGIGEPFFED